MHRMWLTGLALVCLLGSSGLSQDEARPSEDAVKAAYLYNFAKFVDWPATALTDSGAIVIGVFRDDTLAATLAATIRDKVVRGHTLEARTIQDPSQAVDCHILLISDAEGSGLEEMLNRVSGAPVLTVSAVDGFADRGGMIEFEDQDHKIRFEINLAAAKAVGLRISSQLLDVAVRIRN